MVDRRTRIHEKLKVARKINKHSKFLVWRSQYVEKKVFSKKKFEKFKKTIELFFENGFKEFFFLIENNWDA